MCNEAIETKGHFSNSIKTMIFTRETWIFFLINRILCFWRRKKIAIFFFRVIWKYSTRVLALFLSFFVILTIHVSLSFLLFHDDIGMKRSSNKSRCSLLLFWFDPTEYLDLKFADGFDWSLWLWISWVVSNHEWWIFYFKIENEDKKKKRTNEMVT